MDDRAAMDDGDVNDPERSSSTGAVWCLNLREMLSFAGD